MRNNATTGLKSAGNGGAFAPNKAVVNPALVAEPTLPSPKSSATLVAKV